MSLEKCSDNGPMNKSKMTNNLSMLVMNNSSKMRRGGEEWTGEPRKWVGLEVHLKTNTMMLHGQSKYKKKEDVIVKPKGDHTQYGRKWYI